MTHTILLTIFSFLLLVFGIGSLFLIVFPSLPFMFVIALIFGIVDKFLHLTFLNLIILGLIALAAEVIDYLSGLMGAKLGGAARISLLYGIIGMIAGLIIYPPFGSIIGLFLGIVISEIIHFKDIKKALKAGGGSLLGSLAGSLIKLFLAIIFLVLFIIFAVK